MERKRGRRGGSQRCSVVGVTETLDGCFLSRVYFFPSFDFLFLLGFSHFIFLVFFYFLLLGCVGQCHSVVDWQQGSGSTGKQEFMVTVCSLFMGFGFLETFEKIHCLCQEKELKLCMPQEKNFHKKTGFGIQICKKWNLRRFHFVQKFAMLSTSNYEQKFDTKRYYLVISSYMYCGEMASSQLDRFVS